MLNFRKRVSIFLKTCFLSTFPTNLRAYSRPSQPAGGGSRRPRILTCSCALAARRENLSDHSAALRPLPSDLPPSQGFVPPVSSLKSWNDVFLNRGCCNEMWVHATLRAEESFCSPPLALFPRRTAWFQTLCKASALGSLLAFLLLLRLPSCRGDDEAASDTGRWEAPPGHWAL